jgi:hypothetical protein
LVWNQLADTHTPPIVTSDFIYIRFIGDRSIQEKDFGQIQIDRMKEMQKVTHNLKRETNEGNLTDIKLAIVAANNHYEIFAPGTVNILRQLLGMEELKWGDRYLTTDDLRKDDDGSTNNRLIKTRQTNLSDFFLTNVSDE